MEIDYEKLEALGIKIADRNPNAEEPQKLFCPECKKERKPEHRKDRPLAVYWSKCSAYCFNCGKHYFFGKTEKTGHHPGL